MGYHPVEVFRIGPIERIRNADRIGLTKLHDFTFVVGLEFKEGDLAAYVEPDSVLPDTEQFRWLWKDKAGEIPPGQPVPEKYRRIKVKRIKGILSQGLIIPAPPGTREGDDIGEALGITHWNPPDPVGGSEAAPRVKGGRPRTMKGWAKYLTFKLLRTLGLSHPNILCGQQEHGLLLDLPEYDVESFHRYAHVFRPGEKVVATEKIDGANARYVWYDGRMWCGSHTQWKAKGDNAWWNALEQNPWIEIFCKTNPGFAPYGEIYGEKIRKTKNTSPFPYGKKGKEIGFRAFDIRHQGRWLDFDSARSIIAQELAENGMTLHRDHIPSDHYWAPIAYRGVFDKEILLQIAEEPSILFPAHRFKEGIVVRPLKERWDTIGRVQLKIKSKAYMEKE